MEKLEEKREVVEVKTEPAVTEQKVEKKQSGEQQKVEEVKKPEEKPEEKVEEKAAEEPASTGMKPEDVPKPPRDGKREYASLTAVSSNPSMTEMKKAIPMAEKQTDAFDKLDDDEFEKMTSDADEKEILKLAPRLLKVAKKHAAIEKCLTSEENEVLAKFFSGKQKLDANVLAILDAALDKIIDYLQKNNCAVDEETKAVMKKRDKVGETRDATATRLAFSVESCDDEGVFGVAAVPSEDVDSQVQRVEDGGGEAEERRQLVPRLLLLPKTQVL